MRTIVNEAQNTRDINHIRNVIQSVGASTLASSFDVDLNALKARIVLIETEIAQDIAAKPVVINETNGEVPRASRTATGAVHATLGSLATLIMGVANLISAAPIMEPQWLGWIFAILGLRALFFVLAGMMDKFVYLKPGVALILVFVGLKMVLSHWLHIPIVASLVVILLTLATAVGLSLRRSAREARLTA